MTSGAIHATVPANDIFVLFSVHSRLVPKSDIFTTSFTAISTLETTTQCHHKPALCHCVSTLQINQSSCMSLSNSVYLFLYALPHSAAWYCWYCFNDDKYRKCHFGGHPAPKPFTIFQKLAQMITSTIQSHTQFCRQSFWMGHGCISTSAGHPFSQASDS